MSVKRIVAGVAGAGMAAALPFTALAAYNAEQAYSHGEDCAPVRAQLASAAVVSSVKIAECQDVIDNPQNFGSQRDLNEAGILAVANLAGAATLIMYAAGGYANYERQPDEPTPARA